MLRVEFMVPSLKRLVRATGVSMASLSSAILQPLRLQAPDSKWIFTRKGKGSDCKGGDVPSEECGECLWWSRATNIHLTRAVPCVMPWQNKQSRVCPCIYRTRVIGTVGMFKYSLTPYSHFPTRLYFQPFPCPQYPLYYSLHLGPP